MCDKKFSNILVNSLKLESWYRAHLQTAVGHENECKNNSISFAKTKEETQWNCAKKIGDPMKGSKEAKFSNEFDICHSAAALLPEKPESVEVPRLFI